MLEYDILVDPEGAVPNGQPRRVPCIQEALVLASAMPPGPLTLGIMPGIYKEKLVISRPDLTLVGLGGPSSGPYPGVWIEWGDWAGKPDGSGEVLGTFRTATVMVEAPGVRFNAVGIRNSFDYPAWEAADPSCSQRVGGTQAVALHLRGRADRVRLDHCHLEGWQDTLLVDAGRSRLESCVVRGHVDFVFGQGQAVFSRCRLICRPRKERPVAYICAPSTRDPSPWGLIFHACRVEREDPGIPDASCLLGRPWHPSFAPDTTNMAVFLDCWMDSHVASERWTGMGSRPGGIPTFYRAEDARLWEEGTEGPGAVEPPEPHRLPAHRHRDLLTYLEGAEGW